MGRRVLASRESYSAWHLLAGAAPTGAPPVVVRHYAIRPVLAATAPSEMHGVGLLAIGEDADMLRRWADAYWRQGSPSCGVAAALTGAPPIVGHHHAIGG